MCRVSSRVFECNVRSLTQSLRFWFVVLVNNQVTRALEMGREAIGRNKAMEKRRVLDTWKHVVLGRKVIAVQGMAR